MTGRATHGHTRGPDGSRKLSPTYLSWVAMRNRCRNPKSNKFHAYGARGITVWPAWLHDFPAFLRDMGERPSGTTLDREDGKGNYTPANCRWATPKEQSENSDNHGKGWKRLKTHCPAGHEYSTENTRVTSAGHRQCKICSRETKRARRAAGLRD